MIRKLADNLFTDKFWISILIIAFVCSFIIAIPVYFLWNWLMPMIGISMTTFWQSWYFNFFILTVILCERWMYRH
ncbi:hypothetical protein KJ671_00145 [Patescibacteria group bacterium]|nr:hypothetical protein [Patescibacteria group bacterium]